MRFKKRLQILQIWFKISLTLFSCCYIALACNFDEISSDVGEIPVATINYESKVAKREINYPYSPLRIHLYFGHSESDSVTFEGIKSVLRMAASTISQLLEVIPVSGPLLLERLACAKKWNQGVNKGLCSGLQLNYRGEFCENKIDFFKIPAQHLAGLEVYNMTGSSPIYSLPSGEGIPDADFIMYVISHVSDFCLHQKVEAYASYCRLDQHGRPVAGFINFCPNHIEAGLLNKQKHMFHVAVHEMFHSLGFSKDLFQKFKGCDSEAANCTSVKRMIIKDSHGLYRLNLPSVVGQMKKHFNCLDDAFGAPLEMNEAADSYKSHWDPLIMFGSVMAPSLSEPEFTAIDPITLSVFADTGWYKVNLSNADKYFWGKGKGCNFGFEKDCGTGIYSELCNTKTQNHLPGCDFWHYTMTQCEAIKKDRSCGIFKPNTRQHCMYKNPGKNVDASPKDMRCFLTKQIDKVQPICTAYRCISEELHVWYNDTWHVCPGEVEIVLNETAKIVLLCPQKSSLCHPLYRKHPYSTVKSEFLSPRYNSPTHVISLKIMFDEPRPQTVIEVSSIERFKVAAIEAIAEALFVPLDWIVQTLLTVIESLVLTIYIDPPENTNYTEILELMENVQKFLNRKTFSFVFLEHGNPMVAVAFDIKVNPELELRTYDTKGFILMGVVVTTSVLFIFAAAVPVLCKSIIRIWHRTQNTAMSKGLSERTPQNGSVELHSIFV